MDKDFGLPVARFEQAPYSRGLGVRIELAAPQQARIRIPFKDEIANPGRALHGGVMASAIDIAGALAAWSGIDNRPDLETGTLDLSVNYLAAAIGEDIVANADVLRRGKEIVYSAVDVRNDAGKRIASGLVTYPRLRSRNRAHGAHAAAPHRTGAAAGHGRADSGRQRVRVARLHCAAGDRGDARARWRGGAAHAVRSRQCGRR